MNKEKEFPSWAKTKGQSNKVDIYSYDAHLDCPTEGTKAS